MQYFIGIDVGTGSVRAALVQSDGKLLCSAIKDIQIWNPRPNFYQQSTADIWAAVIHTVQEICKKVSVEDIAGVGLDATASTVVADQHCKPICICPDGTSECDIIMWMDHRGKAETDSINATKHSLLKFTGGIMSLEMEPPKLLWLKKNLKESCWDMADHIFNLCDFLTWRLTGSFTRSVCSAVGKWTYNGKSDGCLDATFYQQIGLGDLCENNFAKLGPDIQPHGTPCGSGLTAEAAAELGLRPGTPVGVGILDSHCGCVGILGCIPRDANLALVPTKCKMTMTSGTSACHLALSEEEIFVPGMWGPMQSAVVPNLWVVEGGQSAAGKLIDFVIQTHTAYENTVKAAEVRNQHICDFLLELLKQEARNQGLSSVAHLTKDLHMWPDYHGNRSPLNDFSLKGMISGLTLQCDSQGLALLYLATVQALAYGTRHIVGTLTDHGHKTQMLILCGGLRKNSLYVQCHADITGLPVVIPDEKESVLLGAAILGATAAGLHPTIQSCMEHMCGKGEVTMPKRDDQQYHEKKYKVFLEMLKHQRQYQSIMDSQ